MFEHIRRRFIGSVPRTRESVTPLRRARASRLLDPLAPTITPVVRGQRRGQQQQFKNDVHDIEWAIYVGKARQSRPYARCADENSYHGHSVHDDCQSDPPSNEPCQCFVHAAPKHVVCERRIERRALCLSRTRRQLRSLVCAVLWARRWRDHAREELHGGTRGKRDPAIALYLNGFFR